MRWRAKVRPPRLQTAPGCCEAGSQVRAISFQPIWQISIHFSGILCSKNSSQKYAYALQSLLEEVRRCGPFLLANLNPLFLRFVFREWLSGKLVGSNRCQYCNQIACRFDYLHYWQENRLKTANFMPIMQTNAVLRLPDALLASARISAKSFRQSGGA